MQLKMTRGSHSEIGNYGQRRMSIKDRQCRSPKSASVVSTVVQAINLESEVNKQYTSH